MSGWWRRRQIKDLVHESLQILVDISRMCPIQKLELSWARVCFVCGHGSAYVTRRAMI